MTATLVENIVMALAEVRKAHLNLDVLCREVTRSMQAGHTADGDATDMGFLLKRMAETFDEMRKECNARKDLIARFLAVRAGVLYQQGQQHVIFRGQHSTASPDVKVIPKIPETGSEAYVKLLAHLGVPEQAVASGVLKLSFKHTADWLQSLAAEGKNPPEGLMASHVEPSVTFRERTKK